MPYFNTFKTTGANHPATKEDFRSIVWDGMHRFGLTQRDLAIQANLSEPKVSRVLSGKTRTDKLSMNDIVCFAFGVHGGKVGLQKLIEAALPQWEYVQKELENECDLFGLNYTLLEKGLPILGLEMRDEDATD